MLYRKRLSCVMELPHSTFFVFSVKGLIKSRVTFSASETEYLECRPFFTDARKMLKKKTGLYTRIAMKVVDRDYKAKLIRLRL